MVFPLYKPDSLEFQSFLEQPLLRDASFCMEIQFQILLLDNLLFILSKTNKLKTKLGPPKNFVTRKQKFYTSMKKNQKKENSLL